MQNNNSSWGSSGKWGNAMSTPKLSYVPKSSGTTQTTQQLKSTKDKSQNKETKSLKITKIPLNCEVEYVQNFISKEEADLLYEVLKELPWENKGMKRDTVLFGDEGVQYNYGKGYDEEATPLVWTKELKQIKEKVEEYVKVNFDICLCGWYSDGKKSIGFHSDREELGKQTPIASISLGAERWFEFRGKYSEENHRMILNHGSLLVMGKYCQDRFTHSLPMDKAIHNGRINLTFRNSKGVNQLEISEKMKKMSITG